jgi:AcrR family transcriptional regulator
MIFIPGITEVKTKTGTHAGRAYHHGDLKNALINAALTQIANHGARALSLREVARATGVSHSSTYRHFPNKESVLATIAEQGFRRLTDAMRVEARQHTSNALATLQAIGVAYVDFGVSYPHHLQLMFGDLIANRDDYPTLVEASKEAYELLEAVVREGQRAGRVCAQSERIVALAAWALVHGLALLIASGQIRSEGTVRIEHRALAASVASLLQEGLSVKAGARTKRATPRTRMPRRRKGINR